MKNLSKTQKTILVSIVIILILSVTVGISYALWTISLNQGGQNDIATSCFNITFAEKNNLSLQNSYPLYDADGKKLKPYELTITNNCDTYASYQMNLEVLNTSTLTSYNYIKAMVGTTTDGTESELKLDLLSNYETVTKTLSDALTSFKLDTGYLDANETKTYTLRLWLDENVTTDTPNVQNTNINTKVTVSASYVEELPKLTAVETIAKLVNGADTSSTDVYTVPDKTSDSCTYTLAYDGTSDNNLRYVGENPCNYVKVDDELWRIIGVMNNVDNGTGTEETRLKLIRSDKIGEYSWDSSESSVNDGSGVNEWSTADLMKLLNPGYESEEVGGSLYYNRGSGTCYSGRSNSTSSCDFTSSGLKDNLKSLIGNVVWNTGSENDGNYTITLTQDFYNYERSNNTGKICTTGSYCNDIIERTTTWIGQIGLMYPSDYGYATSGGNTSARTSCLSKELYNWMEEGSCYTNDWLFEMDSVQWTISPVAISVAACGAFFVGSSGRVDNNEGGIQGDVRPSVYLISKTTILSGDGSETNPYTIG